MKWLAKRDRKSE